MQKMIFESPISASNLAIPDDVTVAQFIFGDHPNRPMRPVTVPWLVSDDDGLKYDKKEVSLVYLVQSQNTY
jgi:hypothetical protein